MGDLIDFKGSARFEAGSAYHRDSFTVVYLVFPGK